MHGAADRSNELDRLLEQGPFAVALRAAIGARGLSLDRLRHRLARRGLSVSVPTLSLWQSGRRRPERPASLRALAGLEQELRLPPGSLRALLGPLKPRGRAGEGRLVQVSQYDHAGIDAAGRLTEVRGRVVLRAEQGGLDRWRVPWDLSTGVAPEVVADRNCRVGRIEHDLERDELTTELVLEAAPEPGESVILEYRALFDRPVGSFVRVLAQPVRDYLLEARFAAVPSSCVRVPGEPRPLVADSGGAVHLVAADLTGRIGIRWEQ